MNSPRRDVGRRWGVVFAVLGAVGVVLWRSLAHDESDTVRPSDAPVVQRNADDAGIARLQAPELVPQPRRYPPGNQLLEEVEEPVVVDVGHGISRSQDRVYVAESETVRLVLEADEVHGLSVVSAALARVDASSHPLGLARAAPVQFTSVPRPAGGVRFEAVVEPGRLAVLRHEPQDLYVMVYVAVDSVTYMVRFPLVYTGPAPAAFSGVVHDELRDGSLHFLVGVDVEVPGRFRFEGIVEDATGRAFASVRCDRELETGPATVDLQLFGLLIHDADAEAPFRLRTVLGESILFGQFPDRAQMVQLEGSVRTARYARSDFSIEGWRRAE